MAGKSTKELENERAMYYKKQCRRERRQYAKVHTSAAILDWDRSRLDAVARSRGFRTQDGIDYVIAKELELSIRSATRLINNGKMTWGQCVLIAALFEMTPREFCDVFMYNLFKETPGGDFRAEISDEDRYRILYRRWNEEKRP